MRTHHPPFRRVKKAGDTLAVNTQHIVETDWLQTQLNDPDLRILDCTVFLPNYFEPSAAREIEVVSGREHWEKGHIPGSAFIDVPRELCDSQNRRYLFPFPSAEQVQAAMSRVGVGGETHVVLYDAGPNTWAARVWWILRTYGFENASVLSGGWKKWTLEGRPVSTKPSAYPSAKFVARPHAERIAGKEEVLSRIGDQTACIINALTPEEFAGRPPVRYGRPGHIPSSVNVSARGLIDPVTNAFLDLDELRQRFERVGATDKQRVITYCGAGIAASSAALALTMVGAKNVALYDGSMSEWAADPALPLDF
jgi:thiosulfate/3-mercaptopyruvate sulfurtransferase